MADSAIVQAQDNITKVNLSTLTSLINTKAGKNNIYSGYYGKFKCNYEKDTLDSSAVKNKITSVTKFTFTLNFDLCSMQTDESIISFRIKNTNTESGNCFTFVSEQLNAICNKITTALAAGKDLSTELSTESENVQISI